LKFTQTDDLPVLDGATALYPLYAAFAEATYPKGEYPPRDSSNDRDTIVYCSTTSGAYGSIVLGEPTADIAFVAGASENQIEWARYNGVELEFTPIGREAFVFFVNSKNKVDNITTEQIQDIYSGKITNWSELGGANEEILAYQRPDDSGSQTMFTKFFGKPNLEIAPSYQVVGTMGGIISRVSDYQNSKGAIGYSFRFYAQDMNKSNKIKLLKINGIEPTPENIKNGSYPLADYFYAVTAGAPEGNEKKLIDWILSPQGQELVEKTGYTKLD
jgi:phosphate transport system substrate-binding protein